MTRLAVLVLALLFIGGFAFLTVSVIVKEGGITFASGLSVLIVLFLAVGIVGALRNPPRQ
ncbi:MAG TPA: hypothetical protein VIH71_07340 [Solirubrobacteraceae bacterium]